MVTYLVTGGAGFIGSNIVEDLVRRGEKVKVLDNFITQKSPRTAIGIKPNGNWIFIFVNGYQSNYRGMTLQELTEFMKNLGCIYALNLSGGYTSSMFLNGKIINPFMSEIEHPISNAILVIPKN